MATSILAVTQIGFSQKEVPLPTDKRKGSQTNSKAKVLPVAPSSGLIQKFPPGFVGQDIESITKRLTTSTLAKSEFETTQQYETRLALAKDSRQLVFVLRVGSEDGDVASFKYDADNQAMTAELWGVSTSKILSEDETPHFINIREVLVKRRLLRSRQYIGSNAFGAKHLISSKEYDEFGLAFDPNGLRGLFAVGKYGETLTPKFSWSMKTVEAQEVKAFLRVAIFCVQSSPKIYKAEGHAKPTIDSPQEYITHHYYLPVLAEQVWIFDVRSGMIITRFGETELIDAK